MGHLCRHEVKSAGIEIELLAVTRERRSADDHRVRFIGGVPMLPHVDRLRRPNEQTGRVRFWIDMEDTDLRSEEHTSELQSLAYHSFPTRRSSDLMGHLCRHEVKSAGIEIELLAVTRERRSADDHRVRFIGGVPMLPHVDRLRRPNEQTGRVRFWIDMEDTDL